MCDYFQSKIWQKKNYSSTFFKEWKLILIFNLSRRFVIPTNYFFIRIHLITWCYGRKKACFINQHIHDLQHRIRLWIYVFAFASYIHTFKNLVVLFFRMFIDAMDTKMYDEHHQSASCYLSTSKVILVLGSTINCS